MRLFLFGFLQGILASDWSTSHDAELGDLDLAYLGDTVVRDPEPVWNYRLHMLYALRERPSMDVDELMLEIQVSHANPPSDRSLRITYGSLVALFVVPEWFHSLLTSIPITVEPSDQDVFDAVRAAALAYARPIESAHLYMQPWFVEYVAGVWLRQCVWSLAMFPDEPAPCFASQEELFMETQPVWRLSNARRNEFIDILIHEEHERIALSNGHAETDSPDFDEIYPN